MTFIFKRSRSEESVMNKNMGGKTTVFACLLETQFDNKRTGNVLLRSTLCV